MRTYTSLYDAYPLYRILYGATVSRKANEVSMYAQLIAKYGKKKPSLLELFCGNKEHEEWLQRFCDVNYFGLDAHTDTADFKCDAENFILPNKFDVILAAYCSIETTVGENGMPTANAVANLFRSTYNHLNNGGIGIFHYTSTRSYLPDHWTTGSWWNEIVVNYATDKDVFDFFGVKNPKDPFAVVRVKNTVTCDRVTGALSVDFSTFSLYGCRPNSFTKFDLDKKLGDSIKLKRPFYFRYWTEPEIFSMLQMAGIPAEKVKLFIYSNEEFETPVDIVNKKIRDDEDPNSNVLIITR